MFNEIAKSYQEDLSGSASVKPGDHMLKIQSIEKTVVDTAAFPSVPIIKIIYEAENGGTLASTLYFHNDSQSKADKPTSAYDTRMRTLKCLLHLLACAYRYVGSINPGTDKEKYVTMDTQELTTFIIERVFKKDETLSAATMTTLSKALVGQPFRVLVSGREYLNKEGQLRTASDINTLNYAQTFETAAISSDNSVMTFDEAKHVKRLVSAPGTSTYSQGNKPTVDLTGTPATSYTSSIQGLPTNMPDAIGLNPVEDDDDLPF